MDFPDCLPILLIISIFLLFSFLLFHFLVQFRTADPADFLAHAEIASRIVS